MEIFHTFWDFFTGFDKNASRCWKQSTYKALVFHMLWDYFLTKNTRLILGLIKMLSDAENKVLAFHMLWDHFLTKNKSI